MFDDGLADVTRLFHDAQQIIEVWTLDAGTRRWQERLARAVVARGHIVSANTPRALVATGR